MTRSPSPTVKTQPRSQLPKLASSVAATPAGACGEGSFTCLLLPAVPTVNHLFANAGARGRVPTKAYTAWKWEAKAMLCKQTYGAVPGRVRVTLDHGRRSRRTDLDNLSKAALDLLVAEHVIEDDSLIESITARWSDEVVGCQVTVEAA